MILERVSFFFVSVLICFNLLYNIFIRNNLKGDFMSGKELRISSNDLYGNVDDRIVRVYACFEHSKYMNNYIVFSFGTDNNKLCYGSVHLKENSLVIFSVKNDVEKYILEFTNQYINDKLDDFKIISLNNINKVELVSYNETEFDKLLLLDEKAIPKVIVKEEVKESKPVFLLTSISGFKTQINFLPLKRVLTDNGWQYRLLKILQRKKLQ